MKTKLTVILLIVSIVLLSGCARKTPLAKVDQQVLKNNALIIGSFSRNSGKAYFRESSFEIVDSNKTLVKSVFNTGGEDLTSLSNPFVFKDDYQYLDSYGSIFAISIPAGSYYLHRFYTGTGPKGYTGKYYKKLTLNHGDIVYIGDIKFEPILEDHIFYDDVKMTVGAKCRITNKLDRDYNIFKKQYSSDFFQKKDIKSIVEETSFNLGNYSDNTNYLLYLPSM